MKTLFTVVLVAATALPAVTAPGWAAAGDAVTVAVFEFESKDSGIAALGAQIADLIGASLTGQKGIRLVERAELSKALGEMGLGKTGIVDETQAVQVGKVLGAKILVTGRAFAADQDLVIAAKVIGTETTRVFAHVVRGSLTGQISPLIAELAGKIAATVKEKEGELVAAPEKKVDALALLQEQVKGKKLPRVSVRVLEEHVAAHAIDPAAETELAFTLEKCGFPVVEQSSQVISDWAKSYLEKSSAEMPPVLATVDVIILGEAFSELGTRTGNLVTSKGRLEVRAIDVKTSRVLAVDRQTETAVDLSEQIAAKMALQTAAQKIAARLIPEMLAKWEAETPAPQK
ncbi:MAG: hypothetical protein NTV79_00605 [Candidatus Aureabacteria bacterium]|nr:hypothetical protein [Candidatus Auribacterota bacterium]